MTVSEWPYYADRFWSKVAIEHPDRCWIWTASTNYGYGQFWIREAGRAVKAHRVAYEMLVGPIPDGLHIDHLCRNHACVNPSHMEPVTCRVNLLRGEGFSALNARKTHCPNGHEYGGENLLMDNGRRKCRTCVYARNRGWRARRRAQNRLNAQ